MHGTIEIANDVFDENIHIPKESFSYDKFVCSLPLSLEDEEYIFSDDDFDCEEL